MNDYRKWDQIADSDDEQENIKQPRDPETLDADIERLREEQAEAERWLRKMLALLIKNDEMSKPGRYDAPELIRKNVVPYRKASHEELKILAMLLVVSHFEEGGTNLTRHPQMLELVRHNRWLEEDPGTLELLCKVHTSHSMSSKGPDLGSQETSKEQRMRAMCLSAINTLAAPKKAGCSGGLLELFNRICTPSNAQNHDLRVKWQSKEFAKDALFDSMFPDMKGLKDEVKEESWTEICLVVLFILLLFVGTALLFWFGVPSKLFDTDTTTTTSSSLIEKPEL